MGSATLYQVARRGLSVIGIDRYPVPHALGSTHGESRITRRAIGEGADYVPLALGSHAIWRELEAELGYTTPGTRLLEEIGHILIASPGDNPSMHGSGDFFAKTRAAAKAHGIVHEMLSAGAVRERFPTFAVQDGDTAFYEPQGGYLRPERCVAANVLRATQLGAEVRFTATDAITQQGDSVEIATPGGTIQARYAVVAAGAWIGRLLGSPFDRLKVTRQVMHWFDIAEHDEAWAAAPTYIWIHPPAVFYGFPQIDGSHQIKVATEGHAETDPDAVDRVVLPAETAAMYGDHVAGRLAGISPASQRTATCLYTEEPAGRFVVGAVPGRERIIGVSACSGHGFKHSAAIGETLARRLHGEVDGRLDPFARDAGLILPGPGGS